LTTPGSTVSRVHFEDFGGADFERLAFAYRVRAGWRNVSWYGQTGSDQGRDIIGTDLFDDLPPRRTVIQCVNRNAPSQAKAEPDMKKAVACSTGAPDAFKFGCRASVAAARRDAVVDAGPSKDRAGWRLAWCCALVTRRGTG
jgi:hypothetical protein